MSSLFIALGTMGIPLAVVLWLQQPVSPTRYWAGIVFAALGVASLVRGWVIVTREERQKLRESEQRIRESEERVRREKATIILLTHMAEAQGVDMDEASKTMERKLDGK